VEVNGDVGLRDTESPSNLFFHSLFRINLHHTIIIQKKEYPTRDVMLAVVIRSFQTLRCFNKGRGCWITVIYSWSLENVFYGWWTNRQVSRSASAQELEGTQNFRASLEMRMPQFWKKYSLFWRRENKRYWTSLVRYPLPESVYTS